MSTFIRAANPIWWLPDHTGLSLNDEYYAFFLTNVFPYIPQAVYQDPDGSTQWSNPVQFSPAGTLSDNLYFDQSLVYRIEVRHGDTQADELIWEVNNFVPGDGGASIVTNPMLVAENMVTNPQFADISFESPVVFDASGTYTIAPGWDLVLTGSGTTTVTQGTNPGNSNIEGNPAYYLTIANTGWTTAFLRQRFENNGALFANGAAAIAFSAHANISSQSLTISLAPSDGTPTTLYTTTSLPTGSFVAYRQIQPVIPASTNADSGTDAYTDLLFTLPPTGSVSLTNIQLVGQSTNFTGASDDASDAPPYAEETYARMVDHEFHVYKNSIIMQAKDSILTGWNFSLNPWQFNNADQGSPITVTSVTEYTADQTILVQRNAAASSVAVAKASNYGNAFYITPIAASNIFALIQYIDAATIAPYWNYLLSSLVRVIAFTGSGTEYSFKMRLIYRSTTPSTLGPAEPIASWSGKDPVFSAGWTAVSPVNDPEITITNSVYNNISFNGFQMPPPPTTDGMIGLVIYSTSDMSLMAIDEIVFDKISLVPNEFAIDANPQTFDQVLRECQFYYEKSYDNEEVPGTVSLSQNVVIAEQYPNPLTGGSTATLSGKARNIYLPFSTVKRTITPLVTLYSPNTGTADRVRGIIKNNGASFTTADVTVADFWDHALGSKSNAWIPKNVDDLVAATGVPGDPVSFPEAYLSFHYVCDARLGLVP